MKDKGIIRLSTEIFVALLIVVFSFNIFNNGETINKAFAYNSGNRQIMLNVIRPLDLSNIFPITDSEALNNYEKAQYQIINNESNNVNYKIIYRISRGIDFNWFNYYLKIYDEEKIDKFINQNIRENIDYIDIILYEGTIRKNEKIDFEYLMWLDYSVGNEAQNKTFNGEIIIETY